MNQSGFIFMNSTESILILQTEFQESVSHYLFKHPVPFVGLLGLFLLFSVWWSTFTVWPRGSNWDLNWVRQTTLRFQSTCAFPVSVSASFPTRCSAKPPEVRGGLRTLLFISCVQRRDVSICSFNGFTTLLQEVL